MTIRIATLSIATLALFGCDNRNTTRRSADAAEASVTVTPPAARVVSMEMGRQAGESLRITEASTRFGPRDTVFLAVLTSNAASDSRLTARWTFQDGMVVDSSGQGVARSTGTANAVTQFRVARDKGWPIGDYTVDVWLNDMLVDTRKFVVAR